MKKNSRLAYIQIASRAKFTSSFFANWENHRAFLVILILFIIFVISVDKHDLTGVVIYGAFPLLFITAGHLPVKPILKRLTLLSPFILIMASANPIIDNAPFFKTDIFVISSGMVSGIVIVMKSMVTISAVLAFMLCVPFFRICEILREFGTPNVFVTQLALLYRYSFLLVEEAMSLQKARNLRSFGKKGKDLFTTARLIGVLLLRTNNKAERLYRGMVARGFNESLEKKTINGIRKNEVLFISIVLFIFSVIRIIF